MAVLAMISPEGLPYAAPISPVYIDGKIYFHSSNSEEGLKKASLKNNDNVVLTYVGYNQNDLEYLPNLSVNYVSAIVRGTASIVTDEDKKKSLTVKLAEIQFPMSNTASVEKVYDAAHNFIDLWEVNISSMTGKGRNKHLYFK